MSIPKVGLIYAKKISEPIYKMKNLLIKNYTFAQFFLLV